MNLGHNQPEYITYSQSDELKNRIAIASHKFDRHRAFNYTADILMIGLCGFSYYTKYVLAHEIFFIDIFFLLILLWQYLSVKARFIKLLKSYMKFQDGLKKNLSNEFQKEKRNVRK